MCKLSFHCYDMFLVYFYQVEIAKAWKIRREEPIIVRLHLSLSRYLDATGIFLIFQYII